MSGSISATSTLDWVLANMSTHEHNGETQWVYQLTSGQYGKCQVSSGYLRTVGGIWVDSCILCFHCHSIKYKNTNQSIHTVQNVQFQKISRPLPQREFQIGPPIPSDFPFLQGNFRPHPSGNNFIEISPIPHTPWKVFSSFKRVQELIKH